MSPNETNTLHRGNFAAQLHTKGFPMIALKQKTAADWAPLKLNRWQQLFTAEQAKMLPALYSQDGKGAAATAVIKYFAGGLTWFASEFDPETGVFFGYVVNHRAPEDSEWGYFTAAELSASQVPKINRGPNNSFRIIPVVERDLSFRPQTIAAAVLAAGGLDLAGLDKLSDTIDADLAAADAAAAAEEAAAIAAFNAADPAAAAEEAARAAFDANLTTESVFDRQEARDRAANPPPAAGLNASDF